MMGPSWVDDSLGSPTRRSLADCSKKLIHLQAAVVEHAEREEFEEFPLLAEQLDAAELAGVESAFANFAVGPFASVLDRARDALRGSAA
jgi:hypothetical protein